MQQLAATEQLASTIYCNQLTTYYEVPTFCVLRSRDTAAYNGYVRAASCDAYTGLCRLLTVFDVCR